MKYNLTSKVVTDKASNMCAAFEAGVCLPGLEESDDDEFPDIYRYKLRVAYLG